MFFKIDQRYALYEVTKTDPYTYDSEESCFREVTQYSQVPISHAIQSLRVLSFYDHILLFVIDDTILAMLDIWQSWSKFAVQTELDHISNIRLVKVD